MLRILGTSRNGQVVRLRQPKCVIGSGPACSLRVRARGVQPIHCLVLRGAANTVIRRWSSDTRLNGRAFTDAPLGPGDRLSLGPVEFEVLETGAALPGQLEPAVESQDLKPELKPDDGKTAKTIRVLEDRLALARHQGRRRVRGLVERLRAARGELSRGEARQADLDARTAAIDARQAETDACGAELAVRIAELDAREGSLRALEAEFRVREEEVAGRETAALQAVEPREARSNDPPMDTASVFRRLGLSVPADDVPEGSPGEPGGLAEDSGARPTQTDDGLMMRQGAPRTPAAHASGSPPASGPEEESVDQYMARLLERVRAVSGGSGPARAVEAEEAHPRGEPTTVHCETPTLDPETAGVSAGWGATALPASRSPASERSEDLSGMRELAQFAAQAAIGQHARRGMRRLRAAKLIVALFALASGGAMIWMWWFFRAGVSTFYSGLVALLIAVFWGVQHGILTGRLVVSRSGHLEWKTQKHLPAPGPAPPGASEPEGGTQESGSLVDR